MPKRDTRLLAEKIIDELKDGRQLTFDNFEKTLRCRRDELARELQAMVREGRVEVVMRYDERTYALPIRKKSAA